MHSASCKSPHTHRRIISRLKAVDVKYLRWQLTHQRDKSLVRHRRESGKVYRAAGAQLWARGQNFHQEFRRLGAQVMMPGDHSDQRAHCLWIRRILTAAA